MFSRPLENWKKKVPWLAAAAGLGIAPGFFLAMIVGPWAGEISYQGFFSYDGPVFFQPDFGGLLRDYSVLGRGLPSAELFARALPLALAAYIIGFGDIITGTEIIAEANRDRPDEKIPFDERRTHLTLGFRNGLVALFGGPFFPLQGAALDRRHGRGRRALAARPRPDAEPVLRRRELLLLRIAAAVFSSGRRWSSCGRCSMWRFR